MAIIPPSTVAASKELCNPGATVFLSSQSLTVATFFLILAITALLVPALDATAVSIQSFLLGPPALVASFPTSIYVSSHTLSL